jgi:hypothetical protein
MAVTDRKLPEQPFIVSSNINVYGGFYSMAIDPSNSEIYVGDAIDHAQNGIVYRYSPSGNRMDQFKVGITPSDFAFKFE